MENHMGLGDRNKVGQYYEAINDDQLGINKRLLDKLAKNIIPTYKWNADLGSVASSLIYYFNGLESEYDLNKSIALTGSYGVGKTILMKIFQEYIRYISGGYGHPNIFRIVSIEDVISIMSGERFMESELLYNYRTELDRPVRKPANLLINEFGFKYEGKVFGTNYQELIEIFLMKRYDIFQDFGKLTHVTMNLDTSQLSDVFPERIVDRFKEMFNVIHIDGRSNRR